MKDDGLKHLGQIPGEASKPFCIEEDGVKRTDWGFDSEEDAQAEIERRRIADPYMERRKPVRRRVVRAGRPSGA